HRATIVLYLLSLHDALPILRPPQVNIRIAPCEKTLRRRIQLTGNATAMNRAAMTTGKASKPASSVCVLNEMISSSSPINTNNNRSEEHTSELQSRENLVCRL